MYFFLYLEDMSSGETDLARHGYSKLVQVFL